MTTRSQFRFQVPGQYHGTTGTASPEIRALVEQLNVFSERLQNGGVPLWGLKLDFQRTAVPSDAPVAGTPSLVGVTVGGVQKVYMYDGTNWVQL